MKTFSTAVGKELNAKLFSASGNAFAATCGEVLRIVYTDLITAPKHGKLRAAEIAFYTLDGSLEGAIALAFTCSACETNFDEQALAECLHKITSFRSSPTHASHYYLLLNRPIKTPEVRHRLTQALDTLIESGHVDGCTILDQQQLIDFVSAHMRSVLSDAVLAANVRFRTDYRRRMDQHFYERGIPFIVDNERVPRNDVCEYIGTHVLPRYDGRSNARCWIFVISEFGFGKTSLLLNIPDQLVSKSFIYIPVAQLPRIAFTSQSALVQAILEIILEAKVNTKASLRDKFMVMVFTLMLRESHDIVILFDGLDEHHVSYRKDGILTMFRCITTFQPNIIFTIRKELTDDRAGDLRAAQSDPGLKQRPDAVNIYLSEWEKELIIAYLEDYMETAACSDAGMANLRELDALVREDKYDAYFGDIPRRPLFLKMLADDVRSDGVKARDIAQIYEVYLSRKFSIDRETSVLLPRDGRPLRTRADNEYIVAVIFKILTRAAGQMYEIDNGGHLVLSNYITEEAIIKIIKETCDIFENLSEVLMHSVLVPFDQRSGADFKVKFAHKSFQEYFLALFVFDHIAGDVERDAMFAEYTYPRAVVNFLVCLLKNAGQTGSQDILMSNQGYNRVREPRGLFAQLKSSGVALGGRVMLSTKNKARTVFISYAHSDESLKKELEKHLKMLQREGLISVWSDRDILPGTEWGGQIDDKMLSSDIILLLVSPDFIASDYCFAVEVVCAMKRHERREARVIPIILRPTDWKGALFGKIQVLPRDAKPITEWPRRDTAFVNVVEGLRRVIRTMNE